MLKPEFPSSSLSSVEVFLQILDDEYATDDFALRVFPPRFGPPAEFDDYYHFTYPKETPEEVIIDNNIVRQMQDHMLNTRSGDALYKALMLRLQLSYQGMETTLLQGKRIYHYIINEDGVTTIVNYNKFGVGTIINGRQVIIDPSARIRGYRPIETVSSLEYKNQFSVMEPIDTLLYRQNNSDNQSFFQLSNSRKSHYPLYYFLYDRDKDITITNVTDIPHFFSLSKAFEEDDMNWNAFEVLDYPHIEGISSFKDYMGKFIEAVNK